MWPLWAPRTPTIALYIVHLEQEKSAIVAVRIEDGELGEDDIPLLYHERAYWRPGDRAR